MKPPLEFILIQVFHITLKVKINIERRFFHTSLFINILSNLQRFLKSDFTSIVIYILINKIKIWWALENYGPVGS